MPNDKYGFMDKTPVRKIKKLIPVSEPVPKFKTREEFNAEYNLDNPTAADIKRVVRDIGKRIINKTGAKNLDEVLAYYKKKYNLPEGTTYKNSLSSDRRLGEYEIKRDAKTKEI
jgi:hypothetical protein